MIHLKCPQHLLILLTFFILNSKPDMYAQGLASKIDSVLHHKFNANTPGASFLISRNGKILYKKALGLSNLELNVPMHTENVFQIASMTKQFTAIAILILEEKGKLKVTDEITKFLPNYPTQGHKITIHHLLTHTSGIKDFTRVRGLNTIAQKNQTPSQMIAFFKNESMDFAPGKKFKYNNSGYLILGAIIENITGQTYADFIEEHIFKKLGMNSSYYASHQKIIKNRASGYHKRVHYVNNGKINFSVPYASGSLMSTVADLFTWQEALKNNLLIGKETTKKAFTNYTLSNGEKVQYGYGWHLKANNGVSSREHGGHIFGFKSMGVYLPDSDIYVVGLTNCDCNSPTQITREIAALTHKYSTK